MISTATSNNRTWAPDPGLSRGTSTVRPKPKPAGSGGKGDSLELEAAGTLPGF